MAFSKITIADTSGKGVIGLPDTPELSASEMQRKFDELATDVIIPKYNSLVDEIINTSAASQIGANAIIGYASSPNVQSALEAIANRLSLLSNNLISTAGAGNVGELNYGNVQIAINTLLNFINILYGNTGASKVGETNFGNVQDAINTLKDYKDILQTVNGADRVGAKPPSEIVSSANTVQEVLDDIYLACKNAGGDMTKAVYDTQNRGYVDHAEVADKIANMEASGIQTKVDEGLETTDKTVVGAINELKRSSEIFDSTAMFYIDKDGHYCVQTLQPTEIIEFRVVNNHLIINVDV